MERTRKPRKGKTLSVTTPVTTKANTKAKTRKPRALTTIATAAKSSRASTRAKFVVPPALAPNIVANTVASKVQGTRSRLNQFLRRVLFGVGLVALGLVANSKLSHASTMKKSAAAKKTMIANAVTIGASEKPLRCVSNSKAPVYHGMSGRWTLQALVHSDFTLKDVTLKNNSRKDVGSKSDRAARDPRITDERVFKLAPDTYCNYEINLPRDFSGEKSFKARLVETCDNMFDGSAELHCSIN